MVRSPAAKLSSSSISHVELSSASSFLLFPQVGLRKHRRQSRTSSRQPGIPTARFKHRGNLQPATLRRRSGRFQGQFPTVPSIVRLFPSLPGVQYGVSVSESSLEIRSAFVRKVYTILCTCSPSPSKKLHSLTHRPRFLVAQIVSKLYSVRCSFEAA